MDATTPTAYFLVKRSCLFFLTFILSIVLLSGIAAFIIFVVLKPQKPLFTIQTAKLESYNLDIQSNKDLFLSSLLSFNFNAANPNKFGISYTSSRLHVLENGIVTGMIKVPHFHQPPNSKNISVQARVILDCFNVSQIIASEKLTQDNSYSRSDMSPMRIFGDIRVQLRLLQVTFPKLRVALDCGITMDQNYLKFNSKMSSTKWVMSNVALFKKHISIPTVSQLLSKKCSISIYI